MSHVSANPKRPIFPLCNSSSISSTLFQTPCMAVSKRPSACLQFLLGGEFMGAGALFDDVLYCMYLLSTAFATAGLDQKIKNKK